MPHRATATLALLLLSATAAYDGTSSDWVDPAGSRRPGPVTKLTPAQ